MTTFDISYTLSTDDADEMMTTLKASEISICVCLVYGIHCDRDYPQDVCVTSGCSCASDAILQNWWQRHIT